MSDEPVKYTWTNTELHNARLLLTAQLEDLIKPFMRKYNLSADQLELNFSHTDVWIKVKI